MARPFVLRFATCERSFRSSDHIFLMRDGTLIAEDTPHEVFTREIIQDVFGIDSRFMPHPISG